MKEVEYIKHLGILKVEPGDVVVVRADHLLSDINFKSLTDRLRGVFPNNTCLILEKGADIGVMREGTR